MFLFDLLVLCFSTSFWADFFYFSFTLKFFTLLFITITGLLTLYLKGYYRVREFNITGWNIYRLFEGVIFAHVPAALFLYFFIDGNDLLKLLGLNIVCIYSGLLIYRLCYHIYLFKFKKIKNILILGTDERAKVIADEIQGKYALKMHVTAFVKENANDEEIVTDENIPVYVAPDNLNKIIKEHETDIVVIAQPTELIMGVPLGIKIYKMPEFYEMVTGKCYVDEKTMTELYYQFATHKSYVYDFCKRAYDIIAALIILLVTLPITGFTAIRIWLTDKKNPIYTQTRIGMGGKEFKCFKLRTMYANNYVPKTLKKGGYAQNQDVDDRVIPWCKFVRKARFDEIPQMINILKGDMSIVGPRAEWDEVVKIYKEQIPYYSARMWVKTGWTGWAQINQGHLFSVDDEAGKLVYDLYYIKHRNVLWEIGILIKAVFMALGGRHD